MSFFIKQPRKRHLHQGCKSSDFSLISEFLHKTPFSDFECIEKHIFSGISDYLRLFRLFLTDALTPVYLDREIHVILIRLLNCKFVHLYITVNQSPLPCTFVLVEATMEREPVHPWACASDHWLRGEHILQAFQALQVCLHPPGEAWPVCLIPRHAGRWARASR